MQNYYVTKGVDILTSLSNLAFLIPAIAAAKEAKRTRNVEKYIYMWTSL